MRHNEMSASERLALAGLYLLAGLAILLFLAAVGYSFRLAYNLGLMYLELSGGHSGNSAILAALFTIVVLWTTLNICRRGRPDWIGIATLLLFGIPVLLYERVGFTDQGVFEQFLFDHRFQFVWAGLAVVTVFSWPKKPQVFAKGGEL